MESRRSRLVFLRSSLLATALLGLQACSTHRDPVYIASDLPTRGISVISLAPIADERTDPFVDVQMLTYVRRTLENALREKGYAVKTAAAKSGPAAMRGAGPKTLVTTVAGTPGERAPGTAAPAPGEKSLTQMSDRELAEAAPADARWLMVVSLERAIRSAQEIGDMSRVQLSGRLIDVSGKTAVWRDTAEGEADIGGLLTVLTGPSTEYEGAYDASRLLVSTLPDGPYKGRQMPLSAPEAGGTESSESGLMRPAQPR